MNQKNIIQNLSFQFAIKVLGYCEELDKNRKYSISNQLMRSGTSIGANIAEAQNAESHSDFVHKLKIAAKEAGETEYG